MTPENLDELLSAFELLPNSNRFVIGTHNTGITVYNQQVRALNLLYLLRQLGRVTAGAKIGVIGGGAAGITAFLGAQRLGFQSWLFEERPTLVHLQSGCDTRWIHPRIYDWPDEGTDFPYAGLPILDWQEDTAGQVARALLNQFNAAANHDRVYRRAGVEVFGKRVRWEGSTHPSDACGEREFEAIIFAVGFGIERFVNDNNRLAKSYWRNDDLNQPALGATKKSVFVSGVGDGGLIDAIRGAIDGFHQGSLLRELFDFSSRELIGRLREIRTQWFKNVKSSSPTMLYDAFMHLNDKGCLDQLKDRLGRRKRSDIQITLNGKFATFPQSLSLSHASLLNNLIAFVLHLSGALRYVSGKCEVSDAKVLVNGAEQAFDETIIRHGTDRSNVLQKAGCQEGVDFLGKEKLVTDRRIARPIWSAGWWSQNTEGPNAEKREFVPPATQIIATTFIATLSDIIRLRHTAEHAEFRLTLHRIFSFNDELVYQQICRYVGTKKNGSVGRVFPIDAGLVGYVCRAGIPAIFVRKSDSDETLKALSLARIGSTPLSSVLAVPFKSAESKAGDEYVNLVLFLDSSKPDFFANAKGREILEIIYACSEGFVRNIESMCSNQELYFPAVSFPGHRCDPNALVSLRSIADKFDSLYLEESVFADVGRKLQFSTVDTFHADFVRNGLTYHG